MPLTVHSLLHETPQGASVSFVYQDRDFALNAARNSAEACAAKMQASDYAGAERPGPDLYEVVVRDYGSWAVLSLRHKPTGEEDGSFRWTVQAQELVETRLPAPITEVCNPA